MVRKKTLSELQQAEIRLEALLQRRDALNQEAALARQERDMVHGKKRELSATLREIRGRRDALVAEARAHRAKRDTYQGKAKSLIELKRKLRSRSGASASEELRSLKRQTAAMELKQQTASLSLAQENELIDEIKEHVKRVKELQVLKDEQDKILKEVRDLDGTITDLFARADAEHKAASELSARAEVIHRESVEVVQAVSALIVEGDTKHQAYIEARTKADDVHAKVVEMREKVLSIRGTQRAEQREARDLLRYQNRSVRRALYDEKKLEEAADEAVKVLLQKGRVEI